MGNTTIIPTSVMHPVAMESERVELILVPLPAMGHVVSAIEVGKLLVRHDHRLSITILVLTLPSLSKITAYIESLPATTNINFVTVSLHEPDGAEDTPKPRDLIRLMEERKDLVKAAVDRMVGKFGSGPCSPRLAGFIIDMFCTPFIDVANEFGVNSYMFFTSGAAFLVLLSYLLDAVEKGDTVMFKDSELLDMPMFSQRFPAKLLPSFAMEEEAAKKILKLTGRFRETKGIMVNSFQELESYAIDALIADRKIPPVYPVGPVLNIDDNDTKKGSEDVMAWLDDQPPMSVVFLCFGSMGTFDLKQVPEIAIALERSGKRFLWSLRRPPSNEDFLTPTDYENVEEVLPEGFLTRTAGIGKVIGWAPQVAVLGHPAVGGFVSHCGWNSILESLWFGVPLAAWPLGAEQQMNAFQIIMELGLGVEVRMDYRKDWTMKEANMVVKAAEIEKALEQLMDEDCAVRNKVKEVGRKSREVLMDGGSSDSNLARFVRDIMGQ